MQTTIERVTARADTSHGEEKCRIEPAAMLDDFLAGKVLARRDGQSFEADVLQSLSRLFMFEDDVVLEVCIKQGSPLRLLDYLIDQLVTLSLPQALKLANWAKTWKNGLLLRDPAPTDASL